MHISKLSLVNYRNFARTTLLFRKGVNTIIGENGAGKSNVLRAIRLLLDDNMVKAAHRLDETDFHRGLVDWRGHWLVIGIELEEVSQDEAVQALFLHGTGVLGSAAVDRATYTLLFRPKKNIRMKLAEIAPGDHSSMQSVLAGISIEDYETVFMGRTVCDLTDAETYKSIVGDFERATFNSEIEVAELGARVPAFLSVTKEVSFAFVQALRDVVSEFHNNRTNPLLTLLKSKTGELDPLQLEPIVESVRALNGSIEALPDVHKIRNHIRDTISETVGQTYSPASIAIKSELPADADRLFQSLRLFVGETGGGYEGAIHELSLGSANLIYLTLKLLEFKYQRERQSIANFLLVEEPEAHLHTHVQKTLFDRIGFSDTQIIYTTHSTHLAEVSNIRSVNILARHSEVCESYQPATGLDGEKIDTAQRYLDAVRSNLLFAKSILLVEGDAEEILIPIMVKRILGVSLDELGVSLVNIRSTGFENVAVLFHKDRIRRRCGIVTDLDSAFIDLSDDAGDGEAVREFKASLRRAEKLGAARNTALINMSATNEWLEAFFATHTFEVEIVASGNTHLLKQIVDQIYSRDQTRIAARADLDSADVERYGTRVLTMARRFGKGWFALLLGKYVDWDTKIPQYIVDAIRFAHGPLSRELLFNIYKYRVSKLDAASAVPRDGLLALWPIVKAYRSSEADLETLARASREALGDDAINRFL